MTEEKFDFVVILNGIATNIEDSNNSELIELNWCSYDISNKSVNAESSYLIRPKNIKEINMNFFNSNNINIAELDKADDLLEVLKKFNIFIFETYTRNNYSFAFITKDDWLLGTQLKRESVRKGIKLGYHLDKYFNLINEFKKFYKIEKNNSYNEQTELKDLLQYLNLKQTDLNRPSMMELNTLVRIVNRMIKDGHQFRFSSVDKQEMIKENEQSNKEDVVMNNVDNIINNQKKNEREIVPVSTQVLTWKKQTEFYFRIKHLTLYVNKKEIQDLLHQYDIDWDDITLSYDIFGRQTGEAVIRIYSESDLNEILSCFKFRQYNKRLLDVVISNQTDYINCVNNNKFSSRTIYDHNLTEKIFVKIKNLNYSANEEAILKFFKDFALCENGIKLFKNKKGNFLGEAVVAFNCEEEAIRAVRQKNGEMIFNSHITLELSNLNEYEEFASSNSFHLTIKKLADYVTPDVVQRCLYVNNLPLDVDKDFLLKTFEIFNLNESNFLIDEQILVNCGSLIIAFQSQEDAGYAKGYLKKMNLKWKERVKKLEVENLLILVNKGNES